VARYVKFNKENGLTQKSNSSRHRQHEFPWFAKDDMNAPGELLWRFSSYNRNLSKIIEFFH